MNDQAIKHHARLLLASSFARSAGFAIRPHRMGSQVKGWQRRIGEAVIEELDHALERHYRFWAKAFVREAMEPGREYDTAQLRALTDVNRKRVKSALRELRNEGVVERDPQTGLWQLVSR